jgi:hypothetical protein
MLAAAPALAQEGPQGEVEEPQRRRRPQNNEVDFQADVIFQGGANRYQPDNASRMSVGYVWLPGGGLDKNDEVVPMLRRFIRQPLELGARFERRSDQFDTVSGLVGLVRYWPIPFVYGQLELGVENDEVENDENQSEGSYWASVVRAEAGVRVLPLLQVGGFLRRRGLFDTDNSEELLVAERSGDETWFGLAVTGATPGDRLLASAYLGYRDTSWDFAGFHPGTLTGEGTFLELRLSYQSSSTMSWFLAGDVASETWNEQRARGVDGDGNTIPPRGEKDVLVTNVDAGIVYWFEGKWGFRISFGGGYTDALPVADARETGRIRFGVGFTSRY